METQLQTLIVMYLILLEAGTQLQIQRVDPFTKIFHNLKTFYSCFLDCLNYRYFHVGPSSIYSFECPDRRLLQGRQTSIWTFKAVFIPG